MSQSPPSSALTVHMHTHTHNFSSSCYLLSLFSPHSSSDSTKQKNCGRAVSFLVRFFARVLSRFPQVYGAGNNRSDLPSISANLRGTAASSTSSSLLRCSHNFSARPTEPKPFSLQNSSMARPLLFSTLPLERMRYYHSCVSKSSQDKEIGEHAETQIL